MRFYQAWTVQPNWNTNDLQLTIHTRIKLTSTLEGDLIINITKVGFQQESQTSVPNKFYSYHDYDGD